jgi:hypothetical protein
VRLCHHRRGERRQSAEGLQGLPDPAGAAEIAARAHARAPAPVVRTLSQAGSPGGRP